MIPAAVKFIATFEHTNATFNPGMPLATLLEPTLFLMLLASFALSAWLGQDHMFDAPFISNLLIMGRVNAPIRTHLVGRSSKALYVVFQAWHPLLVITGIAFQHTPVGDYTTIHFIQPDLMAILGRFASFVTPDDIAVRLKDADDLLSSWHFFAGEHSPDSLIHHLLSPWDERLQRCSQSFGFLGRPGL